MASRHLLSFNPQWDSKMKSLKVILTLVSVVLLLPSVGWGAEVWDEAAFEISPANADAFSAGAGKVRDTRIQVRERLDVEHFFGDTDPVNDDNGLHRTGSARCFFQDAEPTVLSNSMLDYDNAGGSGVANLADSATNSAAGVIDDVGSGRCWIDTNDNNKLYVYVGVAGDSNGAWVEANANRVKAGGERNLLQNGDFEANATDSTACDSTTLPTGWTDLDAGQTVFAYEADTALGTGLQGSGCQAKITDGNGADGISQVLAGLKANTTYRVTAQVLEGGTDVCTLSTANADTDVTGMVSVDNTAYVQLDGFFITAATTLDTVTLSLTSTATGDICYWDHIAVYRQEGVEVPEASIIPVYDTYITSGDGAAIASTYADVPNLSIAFSPPTENWVFSIKANISIGCDSCGPADDEGVICRIEKDGSEIAGTVRAAIDSVSGASTSVLTNIFMDTLEINPTAGTAIVYTVACQELGSEAFVYNPNTNSEGLDTESSLTLIAFPPH